MMAVLMLMVGLQPVTRDPEQSLRIHWSFNVDYDLKSQIQVQIQEKLRLHYLCCLPIENFQQQDNIRVHPSTWDGKIEQLGDWYTP
ncbi:hypothetical protein C8J55DRAFT_518165 [Lentinula edodes]|uniref:Uncharacterized protein n=1 Tax=Lentinula lateritia TaxID=40482 RepID=A0A9W9A4X9_9AGAR|nr:hypothetical protein C8J55DRAFT_518165 [Lentinula edodes]